MEIVAVQAKSGGKFLTEWYCKYPWLEWDYDLEAVICHVCHQFSRLDDVQVYKSETAFTTMRWL